MQNPFSVNYDLDDALTFDAFEGDFGYGDECTIKNKIVKAKKEHKCHNCNEKILKGEKNRIMVEKVNGELMTFRWCALCCVAMICDEESGGASFDQRSRLNPTGE